MSFVKVEMSKYPLNKIHVFEKIVFIFVHSTFDKV